MIEITKEEYFELKLTAWKYEKLKKLTMGGYVTDAEKLIFELPEKDGVDDE